MTLQANSNPPEGPRCSCCRTVTHVEYNEKLADWLCSECAQKLDSFLVLSVGERDEEETCGLCGEPLHPEDHIQKRTMHQRCENVFQTPDHAILSEDDSNPIFACLYCGELVDADEAVGVPDFAGDYPFRPRCAQAKKQIDALDRPDK